MPTTESTPTPATQNAGSAGGGSFRLTRYFLLASIVAFGIVMTAIYVLQKGEEKFFDQAQGEQTAFLEQTLESLTREHERSGEASLLSVHEAGHANLATVFANAVGHDVLTSYFAATQSIDVERCRTPAVGAETRRACFAGAGARIRQLPAFAALDRIARRAMHGTTVFKVKMFDLRGLTVYSSEPSQVGEDKADNAGWRRAAAGMPASELTHRDRFSAFEGVVENRDLISSYVPVRDPRSGRVTGVFEIYSDATPLLAQVVAASRQERLRTATHRDEVARSVRASRQMLEANSHRFLAIVYGLLGLLFVALLAIVRNGQRIIDQQARAREAETLREQQRHSEKMAALTTMANGISHEVGNPLTIIAGVADELARDDRPDRQAQARLVLEQVSRIAGMTHEIGAFASMRGDHPEWIDVNAMIQDLCAFLAHDRRVAAAPINFQPAAGLPACHAIPDRLLAVLMDLLPRFAGHGAHPGCRVAVATAVGDARVHITMRLESGANEPVPDLPAALDEESLAYARERMTSMGGTLESTSAAVVLALDAAPADMESAAARGARG